MENDGIKALLDPKSIAVVGASNDPLKIGGRPIEYLKRYGYKGKIYPINPNYPEIQSIASHASIFDVEDEIDLVIIAIPSQYVIETLHGCGKKKVKAAIIFSSGYAELGEDGRRAQEEISDIAKLYGMRIVGPNCQGVANLKSHSVASFSTSLAKGELYNGSSAIISQSGGISGMLYNIHKAFGWGAKYWIGTGNEADVHVPELMNYIIDDPDVKVLQVYMEDVKDGASLINAAKKARKLNKPILALKSGRTVEGSKAASSHTGALATEDIVIDAVFDNYGIIRVDSVVELGVFPQVFELEKKPSGKNVAIITNSGGLGVMMVDKCKELGLNLAIFSEETKHRLSQFLPTFSSVDNPVDVTTQIFFDHDLFSKILPILMEDSNVDSILLGLGIGEGYDISKMIIDLSEAQKQGNAIIALTLIDSTGVGCDKGVIETISKNGVPAFEDPNLCIKAVAKFIEYHLELSSYFDEEAECEQLNYDINLTNATDFLNEYDSKLLLKKWNFPISQEILCKTEEEACQAGKSIGYPVVLKISSPFIQHKTEIGGVKLNVQNEGHLIKAYHEILTNVQRFVSVDLVDGILVQEMVIDQGYEISLGLKRDPAFGPIIMVASGGIYIEILKDIQLLVPPFNFARAKKAVNSLKMSPLLHGARGKAALDVDALCNTIMSFSRLAQVAEIEEADLNPVLVLENGKGVKIVDSLIKIKNQEGENKNELGQFTS
ncbi:CoA-binding protein [Peribacillus cavernae]|uniref:CoA-binding protein n=1 Tax=Peribacillus cavernae TaxID=1674310 RepID=A0A433HX54_9BACI|nr:acetate--CoA ligase family protein [Peribacillus cavernae]MDQ0218030.1 acyl-CoA synthetase (NDP forming) [Peribacillus cavernae]RUQ32804.1 CoA-binding protein [Peribacillus cavernae]